MKHIFMLWKVLMVCLLLANPLASYADFQPSYSTAGFLFAAQYRSHGV